MNFQSGNNGSGNNGSENNRSGFYGSGNYGSENQENIAIYIFLVYNSSKTPKGVRLIFSFFFDKKYK